MRVWAISLLFLNHFVLIAQVEIDSLWDIWRDSTLSDSVRIFAAQDLIYDAYYHTQPDTAILLAKELLNMTLRTGDQPESVRTCELLGYLYFRTGRYTEARTNYEQGLEIANEIGDTLGKAYILMRTGYIFHDNGDLSTALNYYQGSLEAFQAIKDQSGIAGVFIEFGSIYLEKKAWEQSLQYYSEALKIYDSLGINEEKAPILLNMGQLYLDQGDLGQALENFRNGLAAYEVLKDQLGIASGYAGLGDTHFEMGQYDLAREYQLESLRLSEEIEDVQGITHSLLSLAEIYQYDKDYQQAIASCERSLLLARQLEDIGEQSASCECLYNSFRAMGRAEEALGYHEMMLLLTDSLRSEESSRALQHMEFAQQMLADSMRQVEEEMAREVVHQEELRKKDRNRNMALGAGFFFLLLSGGFYSRWRYVRKSRAIIEKEKERSENLLLNILPAEIAEELKEKGKAAARDFDLVSILFTDFQGYTEKAEKLSAQDLVGEIDHCFKAFDLICEKYGIEKIKTIGDAYMAAGGLPVPSSDSVVNTVLAGLEMQAFMIERIAFRIEEGEIPFDMRLGIHTGPVVAGIVGVKKFQYDIWGDTVNIASRMESGGMTGKVNISGDTYVQIRDNPSFNFEPRGKIEVKGKGEMEMWFVSKKDD